jgi:uncharacterized protein
LALAIGRIAEPTRLRRASIDAPCYHRDDDRRKAMSRIDDLREKLGGAHPRAATKVKPYLEPLLQGFIANAPFLVMATSNEAGDCDASPKGGLPGFVRIVDDRTLLIPDLGGNRLFQGYQNFESNPKVGLVFMIPGMDVTVRVNGRVSVAEHDELTAMGLAPQTHFSDDNTRLVQGIRVSIDEAYFHCPRSFQFADLWNTETIAANRQRSLKDLAPIPN